MYTYVYVYVYTDICYIYITINNTNATTTTTNHNNKTNIHTQPGSRRLPPTPHRPGPDALTARGGPAGAAGTSRSPSCVVCDVVNK